MFWLQVSTAMIFLQVFLGYEDFFVANCKDKMWAVSQTYMIFVPTWCCTVSRMPQTASFSIQLGFGFWPWITQVARSSFGCSRSFEKLQSLEFFSCWLPGVFNIFPAMLQEWGFSVFGCYLQKCALRTKLQVRFEPFQTQLPAFTSRFGC